MILPLTLIVAAAENGAIGRDNQMIWRLRTDLRRFKALTVHKPVLMGRKTYQSIGKPLSDREVIVMTRDSDYQSEGVHVVASLDEAYKKAAWLVNDASSKAYGASEIMVAGGSQIYQQTLTLAARVYLTRVAINPVADAFFPELNAEQFDEISAQHHESSEFDECAFSFHDYVRRERAS